MSAAYSGSCLCGAVKIEIEQEPIAVMSCFCTHCSKGAGAPNQVIAKFAHDKVRVQAAQDMLGSFDLRDTSSGQPKEKVFCKACATPLWTVPAAARGAYLIVRTAVLNEIQALRPKNEIFVKYRPEWMLPSLGAAQWPEMRK